MTEIYKGHNCRRQAAKPTWRLGLLQNRFTADWGDEITLSLFDVHPDCDPGCYSWMVIQGPDNLLEWFGTTVRYQVADENEKCLNCAIIDVWCQNKVLDIAYITTTAYATPLHVIQWYADNRTWPTPAEDYWKYKAYVKKSLTFYTVEIDEGKRVYIPHGSGPYPTTEDLFLVSRTYDCNQIWLSEQHFATFTKGTSEQLMDLALEPYKDIPMIVDVRTPFLKGVPVTLDEGAIIPFGWKPNLRELPGLNVPYGTIWPDGWSKGDPLPKWECCPMKLFEEDLL